MGEIRHFRKIVLSSFCLLLFCGFSVHADVLEDIGYTRLCQELGMSLPDGTGVRVSQIEAQQSGHWMPDTGHLDFSGKTIVDMAGNATGHSSHATGVGRRFYGNTISLAPGITEINVYETNFWLLDGFLRVNHLGQPILPTTQISNHSWVGSFSTVNSNSIALRRLDWAIETYDTLEFVGLSNAPSASSPLLSSAYNVITVGKSNGQHTRLTVSLDDSYDDIYKSIRSRPDLVVPLDYTSDTTPIGASAAALLLHKGRSTMAEKSEVIRAALMAGADRFTPCECKNFLGDYRADTVNQTENGLDVRFGSGQLNIYNSYQIIAAGEQNPGEIGGSGYDYNPGFGGAQSSSDLAVYSLTADAQHTWLSACLSWHLDINGGTSGYFNGFATLYDLDLELFDNTLSQVVASSASQLTNTENLWVPLSAGHAYEIRVKRGVGQAVPFLWDYGIAWHMVSDLEGDGDGDGMPDSWEMSKALDSSNPLDALSDPDSDQLTNLEEYCRGTNPNLADTDTDGINDGPEFEIWDDSCIDTDEDGCANLVDQDSDGDGANDGPEKNFWGEQWDDDPDGDGIFNLLDPDADNDGFFDGIEISAGSDPKDPASVPHATPVPASRASLLTCSGLILLFLGLSSQRRRSVSFHS